MTLQDAKALITLCIDEGMKQGVLKKDEPEELFNYLDKYFTDTGKMTSDSSEVLKDLEEAAEEWAKENYGVNYMDFDFAQDPAFRAMYHFRAGAKWQKKQDEKELSEKIAAAYQLGLADKEKQMMEGAVEYEVGMHGEPIKITFDKYVQRARGIFPGDKVHIIIVKKD